MAHRRDAIAPRRGERHFVKPDSDIRRDVPAMTLIRLEPASPCSLRTRTSKAKLPE